MRKSPIGAAPDSSTGPIDPQELIDPEIRALVGRLRAKVPGAREEMFLYAEKRLRPWAHKLLRIDFPRASLHAETGDVLHDVLCKLIPYLETGGEEFCSGTGPFHRLTATVLRRTLISMARKFVGSLHAHPLGEEVEAVHPDLQESSGLETWRSRIRVHELVGKLSDEDRSTIELAIYLYFENGQIAAALGVDPGTASRRLSPAKERLGRLIREDDGRAD